MATVGYTGGSGWDAWFASGVNSNNELWAVGNMTMPETGYVTKLWVYVAGDGATSTARIFLADGSGNFLEVSGSFSLASGSASLGGQAWHSYTLSGSGRLMNKGDQVLVGVWTDPSIWRTWSTKTQTGGKWDEGYGSSAPSVGGSVPSHSQNSGASMGAYLEYTPAAPVLSSASASSGHVGDVVTLTGEAFTGVTAVKFGLISASFTVVSDSQLSVTIPAGVSGATAYSVTNAYGTTTGLSWTTQPTISGISPTHAAEGATVTITGTGFTGATPVKFNGTSASFTVVDDSHITATVPAGATRGAIQVTGGGTTVNSGTFTVDPTISSISPTSGPVGGSVTITGTGFSGATSVSFNGTSASFTITDHAHISATVPSGATSGPITVTCPGPSSATSATFTVSAGHTRRGGAWVNDTADYTRRGGVWVQESLDYTRRSGAWVQET